MTYDTWHIIYLSSGIICAVFLIITCLLTVKFRIFELLKTNIYRKKKHTEHINTAEESISSATEKITDIPFSDRDPAGTVVAGINFSDGNACDDDFTVILDIIVTEGNPSAVR